MAPSALLLTNDPRVIRIMQPALQGSGIQVDLAVDSTIASAFLASKKFDAVVIDCDDIPGAKDLLANMRNVGVTRDVVKFALLEGTPAREVTQHGVHFALDKPIDRDATMRCIRVALGMMHMERRKYFRFSIDGNVTIRNSKGLMVKGQLGDLGGNGIAVSLPSFDTSATGLQVQFALPGSGAQIEGDVEISWHHDDPNGRIRTGIKFMKLTGPSKVSLEQWINTRDADPPTPVFIHAAAAKKLTAV